MVIRRRLAAKRLAAGHMAGIQGLRDSRCLPRAKSTTSRKASGRAALQGRV